MPYATISDIIDIFGENEAIQLSNLSDLSAETVNAARWQAAIQTADRLIDSYLSQRYDTPLPEGEIPYVLVNCSAEIARYKLDRECKFRESVRADYEDQINWLKGIAKGTYDLGPRPDLALGEDIEAEASPEIFSYSGSSGMFSLEALDAF